MNELISTIDKLPKWLKIVLALPVLDIVWVIYRIVKSLAKESYFGVILAVVLIIIGIPFLWLIDIITIVIKDTVFWID